MIPGISKAGKARQKATRVFRGGRPVRSTWEVATLRLHVDRERQGEAHEQAGDDTAMSKLAMDVDAAIP